MPSSRSSGFPTTHPSFLTHRFNDSCRGLALKIDLPLSEPLPAWASLPTPPMSGTPPSGPPSDPTQLAGRRRKREDTPPRTAQEEVPRSLLTNIPRSPAVEQTPQRYGDALRGDRALGQSIMQSSHIMPWEQHPNYPSGSGQGYALVTSSMPSRAPQVSPRATRKVKAHVASACIHCKTKHLRCDETRPCRRCVQSGKESTCVDVEHKKRGRPPLREPLPEATRTMGGGVSLAPIGPSSGRTGLSHGLQPILPSLMPSRMSYPTPYAAASVAHSSATAHGQFAAPQRPLSFPQQQPMPASIQGMRPTPMNPYDYTRPVRPPVNYNTSEYPTPLFVRRQGPHHPTSESIPMYNTAPFQLPPILPAPPGTNMDPAIAQQQRHLLPQSSPYSQHMSSRITTTQAQTGTSSDERNPKRPKMDMRNILGPRE